MAFLCCGLKYNKNDIETYWCIETYVVKPNTQKYVGDYRVFSETIEICICKKCGCQLLIHKRFGRQNGRKKLLQALEFRGEAADLYILQHQEKMKLQPQICPMPLIASATSLPSVYGFAISATKQRAKYDAALPQKDSWRNKFVNGKWIPDIFESECRVITND